MIECNLITKTFKEIFLHTYNYGDLIHNKYFDEEIKD